jgi:hypothetical protein
LEDWLEQTRHWFSLFFCLLCYTNRLAYR